MRSPFEAKYGREVSLASVIFYADDHVFQQVLTEWCVALKKVHRKKASRWGKPCNTGHGKPPQDSQFSKKQSGNPSGRPKQKSLLEELESDLSKEVAVKRTDGSVEEDGMVHVYNDAIKVKSRAQDRLLNLIGELNFYGMLVPESPKLKEVRISQDERRPFVGLTQIIGTYAAKDLLVQRLSRLIGPVPDFITDAERKLPKISKIEGIGLLKERYPRMVDTIARFEELYAHRVPEMGQEPDTDYSDNAGLEEIVVYEYFSQQEALREVGPLV